MLAAAGHTTVLVPIRGQGHFGLISVIILLVLVALFAADAAGIVFVVRRNRRLTRPGRLLVGIVAVWTVAAAIAVFVQELQPGDDWWGAFVSSSFIVLYGLVACGVVFLVDSLVRRLRRRVIA